jgi:hypothetical protein
MVATMGGAYREEVFNVILAQLLDERGVVSAPEKILRRVARERQRRMPDVIVTFQGLRTIIEGKVGDQAGAEDSALQAARQRVEDGISHLGVALVYPAHLRQAAFEDLRDELANATLKMAVYSEAGETGWVGGDLNHLTGVLRRTYSQLVKEDVVAEAAAILGEGVEAFAEAVLGAPGSVERAADALGIREAAREAERADTEEEG